MSQHNKVSKEEKTKIVLAVLRGEKAISEIATQYSVHPNLISRWKQMAIEGMPESFEDKRKKIDRSQHQEQEQLVERLYKPIGQRDIELDWLKKNYQSLTTTDKSKLVDRARINIPLARQTELLDISRSRLYYQTEVSEKDLCLMNLIDVIYTEHPTYGKRTIAAIIQRDHKIMVGKKYFRKLMANMGIMTIYPKKKRDLSQPNKQHKIYPYLLRGPSITRVNQVWSTDITYIRLEHGFCYLVATIDWYSRKVSSGNCQIRLTLISTCVF